jgi:integral membrane protein
VVDVTEHAAEQQAEQQAELPAEQPAEQSAALPGDEPPAPTAEAIIGVVQSDVSAAAATAAIRSARAALAQYRVMAIVTGVMLLTLCAAMIVKYVFGAWLGFDVPWGTTATKYVGIAHGWIYVIYLVTVVRSWATMRWGWGRLAALVFAGVVPVMSFIVERRVVADGNVKLAGLAAKYAAD